MEEYYPEKPTKKPSRKKIIFSIIIIVILFVLLIEYKQIISIFTPKEEILEPSECQEMISNWCTECFSINPRVDVWDVSGNKIGESLAKCSNKYFQSEWTAEQDCTGNAVTFCENYIKE